MRRPLSRPTPRGRRPLSSLQLAVLRALWARGEASVAQVQHDLRPAHDLAPTTVATLLSRLEHQGVLTHRAEGRTFLYRALLAEEDVRRSMVSDLADRLFQGDVTALVSQLLDDRAVNAAELERLRALIEKRARELKRGR